MTYLYPSGKEIAEHRQAGIRAGVKVYAKGHCHFCGYSVPKGALYCCGACAADFACEVKFLAVPE